MSGNIELPPLRRGHVTRVRAVAAGTGKHGRCWIDCIPEPAPPTDTPSVRIFVGDVTHAREFLGRLLEIEINVIEEST